MTKQAKIEQHSFKKRKFLPWVVCSKCGLVALNNPLSQWCVSKGCDYSERPEYKSVVLKHTGLGI